MNNELALERIKEGLVFHKELKAEIAATTDTTRKKELKAHLVELNLTLLSYKKNTRAYQNELHRRRSKARAAGARRFFYLGEWLWT